ncbi:hypothetical protein EDB89DRAFT_2072190 [Lactarius sanguifluus]|nr:hypothetical protein EDB89DRAFT_2072190 [Lactarius sanguifluus]
MSLELCSGRSASKKRLYGEDDHQRLTTDPTIYTSSSDARLSGVLPYRTPSSSVPPPVPHTPTQAAAVAHFFAAANEKLPSALNVPQIRGLSNGSPRLPATAVLAAIAPSASQTSPQLSPTPAAVIQSNKPSVNESEDPQSSFTPTQQQESATLSTETATGPLSIASPMPIKPTQSHHELSLPNGYHMQNNYAATLTNGTTYLNHGTQ